MTYCDEPGQYGDVVMLLCGDGFDCDAGCDGGDAVVQWWWWCCRW